MTGVEILSDEHRSLPVRDALDRAADGARRQLAATSREDPRQGSGHG